MIRIVRRILTILGIAIVCWLAYWLVLALVLAAADDPREFSDLIAPPLEGAFSLGVFVAGLIVGWAVTTPEGQHAPVMRTSITVVVIAAPVFFLLTLAGVFEERESRECREARSQQRVADALLADRNVRADRAIAVAEAAEAKVQDACYGRTPVPPTR